MGVATTEKKSVSITPSPREPSGAVTVTPTPLKRKIVGIDDLWFGEKVPVDVLERVKLERFQVLVKQVNVKEMSAGGILLPDQAKDDQTWTHGMCQICALGPSVYRGRKYVDMDLTPRDAPKVGEVFWFNARAPQRIKIDGITFMAIPDDGLVMRIAREDINRVSFTID
jgi:co-chaperonin GroES (HSP10)